MSNSQFLNDLKIVYEEIMNNQSIISYDVFKRVKLYIYEHPEDPDVIAIKNWIVNNYQEPFLNPRLTDAFDIPLKYLRIQEVYRNLPFIFENNLYPTYFFSILALPSEYFGSYRNFYKGIYYFSEQMNKLVVPKNTRENIDTYIQDNPLVIKSGIDKYGSLIVETDRYNKALRNQFDEDFENFKMGIELYEQVDLDEIKRRYINKKLGNIGELILYDKIKRLPASVFVAKDLGNGFGYDMYFQSFENNIIRENLIEVKTTTDDKKRSEDYFRLTNSEREAMIDSLNEYNAIYTVYRVFYNNGNPRIEIYKAIDDNTLQAIMDNKVKYVFDDKDKLFKRVELDHTLSRSLIMKK